MTTASDAVNMADYAHARGLPPQARAVLRQQPQDFQVTEQCAVEPAGSGEHLWLWVEKTGLTTTHVATLLATGADVRPRDVGYSGLKDRWAVTRQWFSLPWPIRHGSTLPFVADELHSVGDGGSYRVCRQLRHERKLRHGTHDANRFEIVLRAVDGVRADIEADLTRIAAQGAPNYFGPQRFGRGGHNLALARALFVGQKLRRKQRGFALSAARGFLFNCLLDARVRAGSWNHIMPGEALMLDGSHSLFAASGENDAALASRLAAFDIHSSGPLPGKQGKTAVVSDAALALEQLVLATHDELVAGLVAADVEAARRALRVRVRDLHWQWSEANTLTVTMTLPPGSYATSVLREFVAVSAPNKSSAPSSRPVTTG